MNVLILGVGGFIGSSLLPALLKQEGFRVTGLDLGEQKIIPYLAHPRFHFRQGDMTREMDWVSRQVAQADIVFPLAAIANPALYVSDPLKVFALDFEANLPIVRLCVQHEKRLIFPSTSEVYGMCTDPVFDEETSPLIQGPIGKERWIYSTSKQLLDRVIHAHGKQDGLDYTLFRPFNWIGEALDTIDPITGGHGRVLVQFLGNIIRGMDIQLVDGGTQRRSFTDIKDGVEGLMAIVLNQNNAASRQIFNLGNPESDISIRTFAEEMLRRTLAHPLCPPQASKTQIISVSGQDHFGPTYQDVQLRVPGVQKARDLLGWAPKVPLGDSLDRIIDFHLTRLFAGR